jgi:tetratricopeptide (TPR) repeat protein
MGIKGKANSMSIKKIRREKKTNKSSADLTFENTPFSRLVKESEELAEIRKEYSLLSRRRRRLAADYQYHSSMASEMFNSALGLTKDESSPWPGEVTALAIDPKYAPAILTVGSWEYIYGRIDEAMNLFLILPTLPENTEDLSVIIEKAGDFLIDNQDYKNAQTLYSLAIREHPNNAGYYNGISYCFAKAGQLEEAIDQCRCAVKIEPDNHIYLNDLAWSLVEAGHFEEARTILERVIKLSPDYELAKANLKELCRRLRAPKKKNLKRKLS